jgi:hypothetical protein
MNNTEREAFEIRSLAALIAKLKGLNHDHTSFDKLTKGE